MSLYVLANAIFLNIYKYRVDMLHTFFSFTRCNNYTCNFKCTANILFQSSNILRLKWFYEQSTFRKLLSKLNVQDKEIYHKNMV